jgi:hypothetical protein
MNRDDAATGRCARCGERGPTPRELTVRTCEQVFHRETGSVLGPYHSTNSAWANPRAHLYRLCRGCLRRDAVFRAASWIVFAATTTAGAVLVLLAAPRETKLPALFGTLPLAAGIGGICGALVGLGRVAHPLRRRAIWERGEEKPGGKFRVLSESEWEGNWRSDQ